MVYDFLIENYYDHTFMIFYFLNLVLLIVAYKLGFAKKIPPLKSIIIYILLAVGTVIVALFSSIAELPTVESLFVIILILGVYRLRLSRERKARS